MNIELNKSDLEILQHVFEWTDLDGDGQINREDLKLSSGLQQDSQVEAVFRSIKVSAGGDPKDLYLTFEEFCAGVMDFPFLLDQFKQEFQGKALVEESIEGSLPTECNNERFSETDFLKRKLKDAIFLFNKALKIENYETNSDNREELVESLRSSLGKLRAKFKEDPSVPIDIINGSVELYLLVRDLSQYHEEVVSDLQAEIQDYVVTIDRLTEKNEKLYDDLSKLESKALKTSEAHQEALQEKKKLLNKLEEAEDLGDDYHYQIKITEQIIAAKEKEIAQLTKEIRQLTSVKTLQEIRITNGRTTEDMKNQKLAHIKYRQSVPVNNLSPKGTNQKSVSPKNDFKIQIISDQLKKKKEDLQIKISEIDDLEFTSRKYYEENLKLKEEILELRKNYKILQNEVYRKKSEDRDSTPLPSLFDELLNYKEGSVPEVTYQKSVVYNYISTDKFTSTEKINSAEKESQTIKGIKLKKNRSSIEPTKQEVKRNGTCGACFN